MTEAIEMKEPVEQIEAAKPYTFRQLSSVDVFLMFKIIGKIGINEFKATLGGDTIKSLMETFKGAKDEGDLIAVGIPLALDIANVLFNNIHKCENEIFKLLAQTSNLTEEDVRKMDAVTFAEMVIDFVKKEEFPGFIKVVSKLFK